MEVCYDQSCHPKWSTRLYSRYDNQRFKVVVTVFIVTLSFSTNVAAATQTLTIPETGFLTLDGEWLHTNKAAFSFDPERPLNAQFPDIINPPYYPDTPNEHDLFFAQEFDFANWNEVRLKRPAIRVKHNGSATAVAIYDASGALIDSTSDSIMDPTLRLRPSFQNHLLEFEGEPPFRVILRVGNEYHGQPGFWFAPHLGTHSTLTLISRRISAISFMTFGILLIIGIYHIILQYQRSHDRTSLYFGIFCLNLGLREALVQKYSNVISAPPSADWFSVLIRIEYLTMPVAAAIFILMLQSLLDTGTHLSHLKRGLFTLLGLLALFCLAPLNIFTTSFGLLLFQGGIIIAILIALSDIHSAFHSKAQTARIVLAGFIVLMVGNLYDILTANNLIQNNLFSGLSAYTFVLFILIKATLINRENALVYRERDENQRKLLDAYQELDEELLKRETLVAKNEELQEEIEVASQQLIQADKLATLGTVVAGVAHDIASPTGLILFANEAVSENRKSSMELIEGIFEADDSDEAKAVLQMFRQKFEKMSKSESDIELGISRINAIQSAIRNQSRNDQEPISFALKELVDECLVILNTKLKSVTIDCKIPDDALFIGRRSQIGQVYTNLISNAADAVLERREADKDFKPMILLGYEDIRNGSQALSVEDNGKGIPKELREKIQEAFFTTKGVGKGTGLGMPIVLRILEDHGLRLNVGASSELGGASMRIESTTGTTE